MDIKAECEQLGIRLRHYQPGNQYTLCPECSHRRKGGKKNIRCLSVKIDDKGLVYNCHNCDFKGARNAEFSASGGPREAEDRPVRRDIYGALQRNSLKRWVRRSGPGR